jgi:hypothetical protein
LSHDYFLVTIKGIFCYGFYDLFFLEDDFMRKALLLLVCLLAYSCGPRYADFFPYHDNGTKKPSFTLLPVFNDTTNPIAQDFPIELSKAIRNRLKRNGKTYSPPVSVMLKELGNTNLKELAESHDLKPFSRFKGTDFVVLIETAECSVVPYKRGSIKPLYAADIDLPTAKVLTLGMRLQIINMKGIEPKVARMELVKSSHMMSPETIERATKGDKAALEMIRSRLARDLSTIIEETVCVKK